MMAGTSRQPLTTFITLLGGVLLAARPAHAERAPQARLVHCGQDTCLRIAGHRSRPVAAIRIGDRALAADGGRNWRVTVPLPVARGWANPAGDALAVTLVDPANSVERVATVALPPGALGRRVELATLVVRAR